MPALDIEDPVQLRDYLCARQCIHPNDEVRLKTLAGGVSNRTVLVEQANRKAIVLKQALAKLRVDVDWFSRLERIHVEAEALRQLPPLAPPGAIPALVFEDLDNHILAMEAVPEESCNWKSLLLAGTILSSHFEEFGRLIGTIHRKSCERSGEFLRIFEDRSFFESLRLEPYYLYSAQQIPAAAAFLAGLVEETRSCRVALVHGDYSPKNILIYREHFVLLDYEVVHFGDPAFDLGFSLTHILSKGHRDRDRRSEFFSAARLYWQTYWGIVADSAISKDLEPRVVRHTLGCLLARAAGRSPLEYLGPEHKRKQIDAVCSLIERQPPSVNDLIAEFGRALNAAN